MTVSSLDMRLTSVPWALPREEIPVSVVVRTDGLLDVLEFGFEAELEVVDKINVAECEEGKGSLRIHKVAYGPFESTYFCSIILRYPTIPSANELVKIARIEATVRLVDGSNRSGFVEVRIGRPLLEVRSAPESIDVQEGVETQLPLELALSGFGDIQARISSNLRGQLISQGNSLAYELVKRLVRSGLPLDDVSSKIDQSTGLRPPVEIDPEYIRDMARQVEDVVLSGDARLSDYVNPEVLAELRRWLQSAKAREEMMNAAFLTKIHTLLSTILVEILGRNPAADVTLEEASTSISTEISAPVTEVQVVVDYSDKCLNEYPPLKIAVKIRDLGHRGGKRQIVVPITVTQWAMNPILNIATFKPASEGGPR